MYSAGSMTKTVPISTVLPIFVRIAPSFPEVIFEDDIDTHTLPTANDNASHHRPATIGNIPTGFFDGLTHLPSGYPRARGNSDSSTRPPQVYTFDTHKAHSGSFVHTRLS